MKSKTRMVGQRWRDRKSRPGSGAESSPDTVDLFGLFAQEADSPEMEEADFYADGEAEEFWKDPLSSLLALFERDWEQEEILEAEELARFAMPAAVYQVISIGDFSGDGTVDLVLQNPATQQIVFCFSNAMPEIGSIVPLPLPLRRSVVVGIGDLTWDNRLGLLFPLRYEKALQRERQRRN